jgi:hypothetical protein
MMNLTLQHGQPFPAQRGLSDDAIDALEQAMEHCTLTVLGVTAMGIKHGEMFFRFATTVERENAAFATGWHRLAGKSLACQTVPRDGGSLIVARENSYSDFELVN